MHLYSYHILQTAMSHVNSPVDEARKYFKKANLSDDATGKPIPKKVEDDKPKKEVKENDDFNDYEEDNRDPLDHKEMDDKEW